MQKIMYCQCRRYGGGGGGGGGRGGACLYDSCLCSPILGFSKFFVLYKIANNSIKKPRFLMQNNIPFDTILVDAVDSLRSCGAINCCNTVIVTQLTVLATVIGDFAYSLRL